MNVAHRIVIMRYYIDDILFSALLLWSNVFSKPSLIEIVFTID